MTTRDLRIRPSAPTGIIESNWTEYTLPNGQRVRWQAMISAGTDRIHGMAIDYGNGRVVSMDMPNGPTGAVAISRTPGAQGMNLATFFQDVSTIMGDPREHEAGRRDLRAAGVPPANIEVSIGDMATLSGVAREMASDPRVLQPAPEGQNTPPRIRPFGPTPL